MALADIASRATEWMERWRQHGGGLSIARLPDGDWLSLDANDLRKDDPVATDLVEECFGDAALFSEVTRRVRSDGDLIEHEAWRKAERRRAIRERDQRQAEQRAQRDRYQRRLTLGEILGDEGGPGPYAA